MKRMSSRKTGAALIGIGFFLIVVALTLVGYNIWDDYRAQSAVDSVIEQLSPETPDDSAAIPDYLLDPTRDMPTEEIGGYRYIGKLSVPSLELELPVMETWDYERMKISPCRYSGTAYLNNLVICAHNYASHFGRLKNLSQGDTVIFTDIDGNLFTYEVSKIEILPGTALKEMQSGGWDLTLFTCTMSGQSRVTVRCKEAITAGNKQKRP